VAKLAVSVQLKVTLIAKHFEVRCRAIDSKLIDMSRIADF